MSDLGDFQASFDNRFFKTACADVLRIVSILSLESSDVVKPRAKQGFLTRAYEKSVFLGRFFYMVFIKGFTPTVFDILPYNFWIVLTGLIYIYRSIVLPFWLRLTGYGQYANWTGIGTKSPPLGSEKAKLPPKLSLTAKNRLSAAEFGDADYEKFLAKLYQLSTHLSPHSQSPGNPFTHPGFPGNFFDHLTGVYKILLAWQQPEYIRRGGLFHSVYGTYDYRYSLFDLRQGRGELTALIGEGAEEIAFALCTADRLGLFKDLYKSLYGEAVKNDLISAYTSKSNRSDEQEDDKTIDGNPFPPLVGQLTKDGYPVCNHITQKQHILSPEFFANFIIVTIADFMEQGAIAGPSSSDLDICLFQFMRFRFYSDLLRFVKPFLRRVPPVFEKYMLEKPFLEPTRREIIVFQKHWKQMLEEFIAFTRNEHVKSGAVLQYKPSNNLNWDRDLMLMEKMTKKYPYLSEPRIFLAATMNPDTKEQVSFCLLFVYVSLCC
jgi:hypothetical protein